MGKISQNDLRKIGDWLEIDRVHTNDGFKSHSKNREWKFGPWLHTTAGQMEIIKKILTFAALHLEEIPKPQAVIMPFCDVAGQDDYEGHGDTIEDALINAVLKCIKAVK